MLKWITAAAVIALLLFAPIDVRVSAEYDGSVFNTDIRLWGIDLKGNKKEKKTKENKKKKKKTSKENNKPEKKGTVSRLIETIDIELLKYILGQMNGILEYICGRVIRIKRLKLHIAYGNADPCVTGIAYGAVSAAVYNALGIIHHNTTINEWDIDLKPDFDNPCVFVSADCIIRTRFAYIIAAAVKLVSIIFGIRKEQKQREILKEA